MRDQPLVSVVMPVYDSARYLREALGTVAAQTYPAVEVIVVDGPSTDDTPVIARAFPGVRYLRQTGVGMWNALNQGVAASNGELIAFLSDDDLWRPDKLRLQVELLAAHPEVSIAGGLVRFVLVEGAPLPRSLRPEILQGEHEGYMPEAMMLRRALFDRMGGFDERDALAADIDFLARAVDLGVKRKAVDQLVLFKRCHGDNLSLRAASGAAINRELLGLLRRKLARTRGGQ